MHNLQFKNVQESPIKRNSKVKFEWQSMTTLLKKKTMQILKKITATLKTKQTEGETTIINSTMTSLLLRDGKIYYTAQNLNV